MIRFKPTGRHELRGRGTVHTGPCPLDGLTEATNIRNHVGDLVEISGETYKILGVETFAKLLPPKLGEAVGILVGQPEPR